MPKFENAPTASSEDQKLTSTPESPKKASFVPGPINDSSKDAEYQAPRPSIKANKSTDIRPNMRSRWKRKGSQQHTSPKEHPTKTMGAIENLSDIKAELTAAAKPATSKAPQETFYIPGAKNNDDMAQEMLREKNQPVSHKKHSFRPSERRSYGSEDTDTYSSNADTNMTKSSHPNSRHRSRPRPKKQASLLDKILGAIASFFGAEEKKPGHHSSSRSRGGSSRRPGSQRHSRQGTQKRSGGHRHKNNSGNTSQGDQRRSSNTNKRHRPKAD